MPYISNEEKKVIDEKCKIIAKKYGLKVTTKREHYSTVCLTIRSGGIDFVRNFNAVANAKNQGRTPDFYMYRNYCENGHIDVNQYHIEDFFDGKCLQVLNEFKAELFGNGYKADSDIMTDYFNDSWYVAIQIGEWNKPYVLIKEDNPEGVLVKETISCLVA